MEPLPWLVVHGDVVWRAALGAFLLVGTVLGYVLSRRKLRRRVSAASASLGRPVQDLTTATIGSTVCVTGVLQASPPLCRSWAGTNRVAASTAVWLPTGTHGGATLEEGATRFEGARARAGSLELVVPGGVIRLCGPVHVVLGSAEQSKGGLRAPLDNALSEALQLAVGHAWDPGAAPRIVHVRDLLPHDRVLVSGEVYEEASAGDAPTDYRHAGARRVLGAQDRGVKVVAVRRPARAQERGAVRGLLAGAAGFVLLFGVGGEVASGMALTNVYDFRSQHHVWTAELAAATPARRACEGRAGGGCLRLAETAGSGVGLGREPGDDSPFAPLHRMVELDREAERWRKQGSEWLRAECEEGEAESCGELAAYLLDRRSPAPDERETTKAKQLLERACELGHAPSCERESGSSP